MVKTENIITCDGPGCNETYGDNEADRKKTGIILRREMPTYGWSRKREVDLCPTCVRKYEESKKKPGPKTTEEYVPKY